MKNAIAIDSGLSWMKAVSATRRITFPAVTYCLPDDEEHASAIVVDGKSYVVGRVALAVGAKPSEPGDQAGFHGSHPQYVQICHVLSQMEADGDYDCLVLSLPYIDSLDKDTLERVQQHREFTWERKGKKSTVRFAKTKVMPQGAGALRRFQVDESEPTDMLMVDVGSCTLDVVVLRWDGEDYHYYRKASGSSRQVNVQAFKNHWMELLRRRDGAQAFDAHYHGLMQCAVDGRWKKRIHALEVETEPDFLTTKTWFTTQVKTAVWELVAGDVLADIGRIVLTGGGAQLVDVAQWADSRLMMLDVWANAEGQFLAGARLDPSEANAVLEQVT